MKSPFLQRIKFSGMLLELLRKANFIKKPEKIDQLLADGRRHSNHHYFKVPIYKPVKLSKSKSQATADSIVSQAVQEAFGRYHPDGSKRILDDNGAVI